MTTRPLTIDQLRPGERFQFLTGKGRVLVGSPVYIKGRDEQFGNLTDFLSDEWMIGPGKGIRLPVRRVEG